MFTILDRAKNVTGVTPSITSYLLKWAACLNFLFLNGSEWLMQKSVAWCGLITVHQLRRKGFPSDVFELHLTYTTNTN